MPSLADRFVAWFVEPNPFREPDGRTPWILAALAVPPAVGLVAFVGGLATGGKVVPLGPGPVRIGAFVFWLGAAFATYRSAPGTVKRAAMLFLVIPVALVAIVLAGPIAVRGQGTVWNPGLPLDVVKLLARIAMGMVGATFATLLLGVWAPRRARWLAAGSVGLVPVVQVLQSADVLEGVVTGLLAVPYLLAVVWTWLVATGRHLGPIASGR